MKKILMVLISFCLLGNIVFATGNAEKVETTDSKGIVMGTSGMTGSWYPVAATIVTQVSKYTDSKITVQASGGSTENIRLMKQKEYQFGMINTAINEYAWSGTQYFKGEEPWKDVRFVCNLFPTALQAVSWKDSGIKTFADLKGKAIAPGSPGSGDLIQYEEILSFYGLTTKDVDWRPLSHTERVAAMKDRHLDVAGYATAWPASGIIELASSRPINLLGFKDPVKDKIEFSKKFPWYGFGTIPAGTYNGMDEDVEVFTTGSTICAISSVPDKVVYDFLDGMFKGIEEVRAVHDQAKKISLETATNMMGNIPLHPGAVKYYKEKGIIK